MKKIISASIACLVLLVVVWLGASFYSARTTGNYVTSLPALYEKNDYMHIKTLEHNQSPFSSTGKFEMRFPNIVPVSDRAPTALGLIIHYKISNLLLPNSAGRLEWKITGDDAIEATLKQLFGQGPTMHGKGHIGYGGQRQSSVELSELLFKDAQGSLQLTPLTGRVIWDKETVILKLKSAHLNARTQTVVTDWRGISMDVNLTNRNLGLGRYAVEIEKGSTQSSAFEGLKLTKVSSLENDRFNLEISQTAKRYSFEKIKLSDVDQEFALKGVDKDSVLSISTILRDAKDVSKLTVDERAKLSKALQDLFNKGFSLGIPRLVTKIDGGDLKGDLNIEVLKAEGASGAIFNSAQRLRATGQVSLNGKGGLDNVQRTTALMLGLAVKTPEGLKTSFQFANGVISANGKKFDVKDNLKFLDDIINAVLIP